MKNETTLNTETEPIVIADECGDTLWDEVLQQEVKACETQMGSHNAAILLKNLATDAVVGVDKK